jgi:hypothetical protein
VAAVTCEVERDTRELSYELDYRGRDPESPTTEVGLLYPSLLAPKPYCKDHYTYDKCELSSAAKASPSRLREPTHLPPMRANRV